MTRNKISKEGNMEAAWAMLDIDGDGEITTEELQQGLESVGVYLEAFDLRYIMNKCDADASGTIDKEEFMAAFDADLLGPFDKIKARVWGA